MPNIQGLEIDEIRQSDYDQANAVLRTSKDVRSKIFELFQVCAVLADQTFSLPGDGKVRDAAIDATDDVILGAYDNLMKSVEVIENYAALILYIDKSDFTE